VEKIFARVIQRARIARYLRKRQAKQVRSFGGGAQQINFGIREKKKQEGTKEDLYYEQ